MAKVYRDIKDRNGQTGLYSHGSYKKNVFYSVVFGTQKSHNCNGKRPPF